MGERLQYAAPEIMDFNPDNVDRPGDANGAPTADEILGEGFDAPLRPALVIATKTRVWGDATPAATEPTDPAFTASDLRERILQRDRYRCRFCDFESRGNGVHCANDNHGDLREENLWTADPLCHGWNHLGELGVDDAVVAYLPGLSGQDVNHLQRSMMVALETGSAEERADALALLNWLASHREYAKQAWGSWSPAVFADALARLNEEQRELREVVFADLAVVFHPAPLAQHAARWATEAYASRPTAKWARVYHDIMNAPI